MNAPHDPPDPSDAMETHLADALLRLDEAAAGGPLPDAARISAHLAGVGDAALLDDVAARADVRRLLSDVVFAEQAIESEGGLLGHGNAAFRPALRARALAAWSEPESRHAAPDEAVGSEPAGSSISDRTPRGRVLSMWSGRARVAAAALVVAVPVALLMLLSGPVEAAPVLAIGGIERINLSGTVAAEGVRSLPVGRHIVPGSTEMVSVVFSGGSRVVLGSGGDVHVACDDASCRTAALQLDRGNIVLSAVATGPVKLLLRDGGRLELLEGDARVTQGEAPPTGASSTEAVLALRAGAKARWTPAGDRQPSSFSGPRSWVLNAWSGSGPTTTLVTTAPNEDLFRDLQFFGGKIEEAPSEGVVSARQWRIVKRVASATAPSGAGGASVRESDAAGVPAIRLDLKPGTSAALAWRPSGAALATSRIEVLLRWKPGASASPAPRLALSIDGAKVTETVVPIPKDPSKPIRVPITLPAGWGAGEESLVFSCSGSPVTVWFEGIAFRVAGDAGRDPVPSAE